jgi:chromate transport protein ChrA
MVVGITYLMTSVTLALVALCIRSSGDEATSDIDTFRYGVGWAKAMLFIAPFPVGIFAILFILAFGLAGCRICRSPDLHFRVPAIWLQIYKEFLHPRYGCRFNHQSSLDDQKYQLRLHPKSSATSRRKGRECSCALRR